MLSWVGSSSAMVWCPVSVILSEAKEPWYTAQDDTITVQPLAAMTWEEARDAAGPGSVAILPVGAIEAHGPHLPLETDVIIAQAMARTGAARLAARGCECW